MAPSKRFICIHGHFYQPPRENPWLETVETQDSAAPYHDWNERICAECYATNGAARIQNSKNQITRIVNNYARISFNFGPTLLSWLKENAPRTYRMILDGERRSRKSYGGHSSAMAQVYNHIIMPLASRRDRITQIRWGIADYQQHYGSTPEGMWLAETAADSESLELMAQHGIKFTLLAPHQCRRVRLLGDGAQDGEVNWTATPGASVDTTRPYLVRFASGASIAVFFYNGPASRAIAFEGLLNSGENFAARLKAGFKDGAQPQMVHVATDGESYGHHHKHGEMALAYALRLLERDRTVKLTNYGRVPGEVSARVRMRDRGRHIVELRARGGALAVKLRMQWRTALQSTVARTAAPGARRVARRHCSAHRTGGHCKLFKDVWEARDAYIEVVLNREPEETDLFFKAHARHELSEAERVRALELMEMQRHAQLMYTSCGWFFDDIGGIETVQIIAYAARVLQLAKEIFGEQAASLEPAFLARMAEAKSNEERIRRWRADLQNLRGNDGAGPGSRWPRTMQSARSSRRLPRRRSCSAIGCSAFRTRFILRAEGGWRWAARTLPARLPASSRASRLRFCTSATRTLPLR